MRHWRAGRRKARQEEGTGSCGFVHFHAGLSSLLRKPLLCVQGQSKGQGASGHRGGAVLTYLVAALSSAQERTHNNVTPIRNENKYLLFRLKQLRVFLLEIINLIKMVPEAKPRFIVRALYTFLPNSF